MKYGISKEFSIFAYFKPPVYKPIVPVAAAFLSLIPKNSPVSRLSMATKKIAVEGGEINAYFYEPVGCNTDLPCLIYYHGGGFVFKGAPHHYTLAREYARRTPCKVLFVDYRMLLKHQFPTSHEDCFTAYKWLLDNASKLGVDSERIAVGGDSAGGNLAAAMCLMARDRGVKPPCAQMLIYPATDRRMKTESMAKYTDTPMWNSKQNKKLWSWLVPEGAENIEYASVCECADLSGLPSAYVETAEVDCLHDEGLEYAQQLKDAGTCVVVNETHGTMHGYDIVTQGPTTRESMEKRLDFLRESFK